MNSHHGCGSGGETNAETTRFPCISTTTSCFKQWATVRAMLFDPRVDVMDQMSCHRVNQLRPVSAPSDTFQFRLSVVVHKNFGIVECSFGANIFKRGFGRPEPTTEGIDEPKNSSKSWRIWCWGSKPPGVVNNLARVGSEGWGVVEDLGNMGARGSTKPIPRWGARCWQTQVWHGICHAVSWRDMTKCIFIHCFENGCCGC